MENDFYSDADDIDDIDDIDLDKLFEEKQEIPEVWLISKEDLSNEVQKNILSDDSYNFVVEGPAGSGKTVLATYKLMDLISLGKKDNCVFIVYTLALREFIKCGLENTLNMYNTKQFKDVKIEELIYNIEDKNLLNKLKNMDIGYIVVDETQDIEIEKIKKIISENRKVMLFGDDGQKLYKKGSKMKSLKSTIKDRIKKFYKIDEHFRVPKSIMKFASKIVKKNDLVDTCANTRINYKPYVISCENYDDELDNIMKFIKKYSLKNVGILINNRENISHAEKYFQKFNFKVRCKIDNDIDDLNFNDEETPIVLTYFSSKGLQFENVFVACCDRDNIYSDGCDLEYDYKNALYVACTRPTKRLFITFSGELNKFMKNIDDRLYTLIEVRK